MSPSELWGVTIEYDMKTHMAALKVVDSTGTGVVTFLPAYSLEKLIEQGVKALTVMRCQGNDIIN